MPAPQAPNAAPVFNWEKAQNQLKPARKKSNPLMVVAAVAMILLAVSGVWRSMHATPPGKMVQVCTASRDIAAGASLGFTSVRFLAVPIQYATPDMVRSLNDTTGRFARTFIAAGEPIHKDMLFSSRSGLAGSLEPHERAITLQLTDDALLDHAILPDDLVDVLVVTNKDGKKYTKTICQGVRVAMCATKEQLISRQVSGSANKITLAATPDVAEAITEGIEAGKLRLVLRNRLSRVKSSLLGCGEDSIMPASAFESQKKQAASSIASALSMVKFPPIPALSLPPPPPVPGQVADAAPKPINPIDWMVEVFSGSKKESYAVPAL